MEFNQILELIDHVSASELTAFTYETADLTLRMEHGKVRSAATVQTVKTAENTAAAEGQKVQATEDEISTENTAQTKNCENDESGNIVTSPLVGTFYAAPSQDLPPYVQLGDRVKKGQVLAIVEAMKLMNEIESDFDGAVVEIYVKNGQPVEYGQKLFRIK